ncbi:MAG: endonuclease/exonuclease/phosphatase family protein, partial [Betaproteobacteria bacterium]
MRVISWNLLRLEGAAVADVAALLERERPDVLLMQEVTQHMDVLLHKVPGHYHRLPWPGRIHGLAVWSRHNFATPHILPLPASPLPGRLPQRRSQIVQVGDITFANVHLSHGQLLNRRQLLRIAAALRGKPSAIIGDYNAVGPSMIPGFADVGPREATHFGGDVVP